MSEKKSWYRRIPWWGWAAIAAFVVIVGITGQGNEPATSFAEATPTATSTPSATPSPSITKEAAPPIDATSGGLTATTAQVACDNYANQQFPYGYRPHWIVGVLAEEIQNDRWFLKVEADITDEYGAKAKGVNVECFVSGTAGAPVVDEFNAY
jgi:hypothetical protein